MRIALSAFAGALWRAMRRLAKTQPRVVHGIRPHHALRWSVMADQLAGIPAHSAVIHGAQSRQFQLTANNDFDVVFSRDPESASREYWRAICHLLLQADVWSTSFAPLLPARSEQANHRVLLLLRLAGIRILAYPYGSDVAWRDTCRDRFDWVGQLQLDYPQWDLVEWGATARANVRLFSRHARFIVGEDNSVRRFLLRDDLHCKRIAVDTHALVPRETRGDDIPLIVHAPNHRHVKGTEFLLAALDSLRRAGFKFKVQLVENTERQQAIEIYRSADIIADQFVMGAYGVFALECLALGKPVLTYLDQEHLANPRFNLPIVNSNRHNIAAILAVLLRTPELRQRIGEASRAAVVRYQSLEAIGELNRAIYDHIWWGHPLRLETTAHFDPARTARSFSENPAEREFWPVPVDDLQEQIVEAIAMLATQAAEAEFAS